MGFFDEIPAKAYGSHIEAGFLLESTWKASRTEYSSFNAHCKSIVPPFARAWQLIRDITRIIYSSCVYMGALFSGNHVGRTCALSNIGRLVYASFLEVINITCSIISIATRTLASLFNGGYNPGVPDIVEVPLPEKARTPEQQDAAIHLWATTFI